MSKLFKNLFAYAEKIANAMPDELPKKTEWTMADELKAVVEQAQKNVPNIKQEPNFIDWKLGKK